MESGDIASVRGTQPLLIDLHITDEGGILTETYSIFERPDLAQLIALSSKTGTDEIETVQIAI